MFPTKESVPYPRLTLDPDLPRQTSTDAGPAILWTCGVTHCITLDGTDDFEFPSPTPCQNDSQMENI